MVKFNHRANAPKVNRNKRDAALKKIKKQQPGSYPKNDHRNFKLKRCDPRTERK